MTLSAKPIERDLQPRLTVIGVGGAGCNAINNMISAGLSGVNFVVANTDAQSLSASAADYRIQLGANLTEGLGAGSKPEIGEAAAEEALEDIRAMVAGSHMVFVAAGMGGGTGTGAAAVIARIAREMGILTVGVVTKPFQFEGARRMRTAEEGIARLKDNVDTLIVIPNQNLFRIANDKTTFAEAFILADQVLYSGVACVVDLIVKEGLINLDFADVRTVMSGMGTAMMGTGEASGPGRASAAAEEAISNPLLDDVTLKGARGLLLSITGGNSLTLYEVDEAATRVRQEVDPEANVIVGATFDATLEDRIRVSIVASGMARSAHRAAEPIAARPLQPVPGVMPAAPASAPPDISNFLTPPPLPFASASLDAGPSEIQRRLSQALSGETASGFIPQTTEVPAPAVPPPLPQRGWMAPGNVMIEEELDQPLTSYEPPPARPGYEPEPLTAPPAFAPMPPAEFNRQRRMPDVQDFPVVGQRDYMSKKAAGWGTPAPAPAAPPAPRRGGWFGRLTGRNVQPTDSPGHDELRGGYDQGRLDVNNPRSNHTGNSAGHGSPAASGKMQETPGLPGFISGRRK